MKSKNDYKDKKHSNTLISPTSSFPDVYMDIPQSHAEHVSGVIFPDVMMAATNDESRDYGNSNSRKINPSDSVIDSNSGDSTRIQVNNGDDTYLTGGSRAFGVAAMSLSKRAQEGVDISAGFSVPNAFPLQENRHPLDKMHSTTSITSIPTTVNSSTMDGIEINRDSILTIDNENETDENHLSNIQHDSLGKEPEINMDQSNNGHMAAQATAACNEVGSNSVSPPQDLPIAARMAMQVEESVSSSNSNNVNDDVLANYATDLKNNNSQLLSIVRPGISKRADFPLSVLSNTRTALLVIDIQEYLSKQPISSTNNDSQNGKFDDDDDDEDIDSKNLGSNKDDSSNSDNSSTSPLPSLTEKEHHLFNVSLPIALRNIEVLVQESRLHNNAMSEEKKANQHQQYDQQKVEIVFNYLESMTCDNRDISTDYKLSGQGLSTIPNPANPATFFNEVLTPRKDEIRLPKTSCSVFQSTNIHYLLQNLTVERLIVCGQLTDQCVLSAVRDAADLGYFVTVISDACAAQSFDEHEWGLRGMQGFARLITTQEWIDEMDEWINQITEKPVYLDDTNSDRDDEIIISRQGEKPAMTQQKLSDFPTSPLSIPTAFQYHSIRTSIQVESVTKGIMTALLKSLKAANVNLLQAAVLDSFGKMRTKAVPTQRLTQANSCGKELCSLAEVSCAGLPSHADVPVPASGLTAANVLRLFPDWSSFQIIPASTPSTTTKLPTNAMVMCTLHNQIHGDLSPFCTRGLLQRILFAAEKHHGITFNVGIELEFCLVRYNSNINHATDDGDPLQTPIQPIDRSLFAHSILLHEQNVFIEDILNRFEHMGINVEELHSESANGQMELVLEYQDCAVTMADNVVYARQTIQACAKQHKMKALFLPKIYSEQAGNGMHIHLSFCDLRTSAPRRNAFVVSSWEDTSLSSSSSKLHACDKMSSKAESFVEGIMNNLPSLLSLTMPSNNSFRRVGVGCWTGSVNGWAVEDKEVPLRVCRGELTVQRKSRAAYGPTNVEFKLSDSTSNIYLALAAVLASGLDGIVRSLKLRPPVNNNNRGNAANGSSSSDSDKLPSSLKESLNCLNQNQFIMGVMGKELFTSYLAVRREEDRVSSERTLDQEVFEALQNA